MILGTGNLEGYKSISNVMALANYTEILIVLLSLKWTSATFAEAVVHHTSPPLVTACGRRTNSSGNARAVRLLTAGESCVLVSLL